MARRNDPMLGMDPSMEALRRRIAGPDVPSLGGTEEIELPDYEQRRIINARGPHAVVSAFRVSTRVILPRMFGYFARQL